MTSRKIAGAHAKIPAVWQALVAVLVVALIGLDTQAALRASLDRSAVSEGDRVVLSIVSDGGANLEQPELAPLARDFYLLGSSSSRQVQMNNGRRSQRNLWQVQLSPRRSGQIEIPPLVLGEQTTQSLSLAVAALPQPVGEQVQGQMFIEVELPDRGPTTYVGQQIRYRVRLYSDVPLLDGQFIDPLPESATLERLGNDRLYPVKRDGREYHVVERNYAVFASESGELRLPPVGFQGRVADRPGQTQTGFPGNYSDLDNIFANPVFDVSPLPVSVRSQPLSLQISTPPHAYAGRHWLPAADLRLDDSWSRNPPVLKVGEPISRHIRIDAKGLPGSQIPLLPIAAPAGLQVYTEQPFAETRTDGAWALGRSEQHLTYVPSEVGTSQVPEIRVSWWDTERNEERVAKLAGWPLQVLPGPEPQPGQKIPLAASRAETILRTPPAGTDSSVPVESGVQRALFSPLRKMQAYWTWVLSAVVLIWIIVVARRRHNRIAQQNARALQAAVVRQQTRSERQQVLQRLRRACQQNDAGAAEHTLLQLAALKWPGDAPRNLSALAQRLKSGGQTVRAVERALFSAAGENWRGEALWQVFANGFDDDTKADRSAHRDKMDPLHPGYT